MPQLRIRCTTRVWITAFGHTPAIAYGSAPSNAGRLSGWPTVFQKRFEPTPVPVVQDRADVPRSTQYNRRHFHVWPSSLEMTTLLPLHSQIVPSPVTSIATWPAATFEAREHNGFVRASGCRFSRSVIAPSRRRNPRELLRPNIDRSQR